MKCSICTTDTKFIFKTEVLDKYLVSYFGCPNCGHIQTEKPYWLDEAYQNAIADLDVGLVSRNLGHTETITKIIFKNFNYAGLFLDYAGGYGLFVRLMRDKGLDFYRQDKYCDNLFAKGFDIENLPKNQEFEAVTALEVFEHLANPHEEIKKLFNYSDTIIFSTELIPNKQITSSEDWWYFTPQTGQHISFYSKISLEYLSDKLNLSFYSNGNLHIFTKKKLKRSPLLAVNQPLENKALKSMTQLDYESVIKMGAKLTKNLAIKRKIKNQNNQKLEKLSFLESQFEIKSKEISKNKQELNSLEYESRLAKENLCKLQKELVEAKEKVIENNVIITQKDKEIINIYSSRSWKLARIFLKMSKKVMPAGSLRRKIVRTIFRTAKASLRRLNRFKSIVFTPIVFIQIVRLKTKKKRKRNINKKLKKLVYIGHSYHKKTGSTKFLIDYLKKHYDVKVILDESWQGAGEPYPGLSFIDESYIGVIFFQNLPDKSVITNINNKNLIFFPMYDATSNWGYSKWRECKNLKIMNFSKTLHLKLKKLGFQSAYVQYFPKPSEFIKGKNKEIFFWQRITAISIREVKKLLQGKVLKLHIHKAIDPAQSFIQPDNEDEKRLNITYSDWFDSREEMWKIIKDKSIYIAPREYEGIGLSFLEAMAMGKAVIAADNPTMNEYITHNKTGYLFNLKKPMPLNLSNVGEVQKKTYKYMCEGYEKWEKGKHRIIDFIESE